MRIDFDAFRKRTVSAYNRLCEKINSNTDIDGDIGYAHNNGVFNVKDISDDMEALREGMVALLCLEDTEDDIHCLDMPVSALKVPDID